MPAQVARSTHPTLVVRCLECHGPIVLMQAGRNNTTRAHAEHRPGHTGCSLGYYFNGTRKPHPQQVEAPYNTTGVIMLTGTTLEINVNDFIAFVKARQGKVISTRKRNKGFTVEVTDKGFEFTPAATNKRRPHELQAIKRVVERFNKTRSYTTSDYTDITYNSSYTLTLIGLYLAYIPTADEGELDEKVHSIRKSISTTDRPEGQQQPQKICLTTSSYVRDPFVKAWVLENAKGNCESCGSPAPFLNYNDEPFLEVHHVILLAEGGSDTICNTIAVCPNCHRRFHYSKNKIFGIKDLYKTIPRLKRKLK